MTKVIDGKTYYLKDGSYFLEDNVKPADRLRDQFVMEAAEKLLSLRQEMIKLKAEITDDMESLVDLMAEKYDVKMGGEKGNLSFSSFDGNVRIERRINERIIFTETILVAKQLIDDYLEDLTKGSSTELKQIVSSAFRLKQGQPDVKAVMKLKELNISDERWVKAMQIIDDSKQLISCSPSINLYVRSKLTDKPERQVLDFSTL